MQNKVEQINSCKDLVISNYLHAHKQLKHASYISQANEKEVLG